MILNALHFVSIVAAFVLIVFGYPYLALIPFSAALALTLFIYRVKRASRKSDVAANNEHQRHETAEQLTRVLLNRRYGTQKGVKEYWQQSPTEDITGIKIDTRSQTGKTQRSPVPIFWLLFVVGVIIWGAYNIVMHDSLYVPLSRVYEKTAIPDKSYQSTPIPQPSSDISAADELKQRTFSLPASKEDDTVLPNTTITQDMLDKVWLLCCSVVLSGEKQITPAKQMFTNKRVQVRSRGSDLELSHLGVTCDNSGSDPHHA